MKNNDCFLYTMNTENIATSFNKITKCNFI